MYQSTNYFVYFHILLCMCVYNRVRASISGLLDPSCHVVFSTKSFIHSSAN